MSESKETSRGLPVIGKGTVESIWETFTTSEDWGEHLEEVKSHLVKENPELVKFIESQVGKYPTVLHQPMFEVIIATIAVLENQAESNKLSSNFNLDKD